MSRNKITITALALSGALLSGACSGSGSGGDGSDPAEASDLTPEQAAVAEAERLYQIVSDNGRIRLELLDLEQRVTKRCMEDQGFTVHHPLLLQDWATEETDTAADYMEFAPDFAVPELERAAQWGFGIWVHSIGASGNEDLREQLITPEVSEEFDIPIEPYEEPDTAWDDQDTDYQAAWYEANNGAPAYVGGLKGVEMGIAEEPGGCQLEMIETMYGEPYKVEAGDDGEVSWVSHQPSPIEQLGDLDGSAAWTDVLDGEDTAFLDCIVDRGYTEWDFDEAYNMPLYEYFAPMYEPDNPHLGEDGVAAPAPPEDAPTDFMDVMALEIAMATDFAECGEGSGLRAAIEYGWALTLIDAYQGIETEVVGWQTEMQGHLDRAQDFLGA